MGIIYSRGSKSPRSALTYSASLLTIAAGAASWSGLAQAAGEKTTSSMMLLSEHYALMEDGMVVFKLETGETLSLTPDQYLILEDGLLLITDELAQASLHSLPVMGSVRTDLLSELQLVRASDGSVVKAQANQPVWSGEGDAPRLFEQVAFERFELAQNSSAQDEDCEDNPTNDDDESCLLPLRVTSNDASEGLGLGMFAAPGGIALLAVLNGSGQPEEKEAKVVKDQEAEEEGPPPVQWETEYWKMFDLNLDPGGIDVSDSDPAQFTEFQGDLYFRAAGEQFDWELWKFDGTNASIVENIYPGVNSIEYWQYGGDFKTSYPSSLVEYDDALYFVANDELQGRELFKFDGTDVSRVTNLNTDPGGNSFLKYEYWGMIGIDERLVEYQGSLYFTAFGNDGKGIQLWKYNETDGAVRVTDIIGEDLGMMPSGLTVFDNELYFYGWEYYSGYELWKYNDTDGASQVDDIWTGSSSSYGETTDFGIDVVNMAVYDNALYFAADGNDGKGLELWKYDGGASATLFADINEGPSGSDPDNFLVADGLLFFEANDGVHGEEMWQFDGTAVSMVVDALPGPDGSNPRRHEIVQDKVWVETTDDTYVDGLFYLDSTGLNYFNHFGDPFDGDIDAIGGFDKYIVVQAQTEAYGDELWVYNPDGWV